MKIQEGKCQQLYKNRVGYDLLIMRGLYTDHNKQEGKYSKYQVYMTLLKGSNQ